jgi:exocyst complex component 4
LIHDINQEREDEPNSASDSHAEDRKSNSSKYSEWLMELVEVMADYET